MRIGNILFNIVLIAVLLFSAFTAYLFATDTGVYAVESGSMSPTLSVGDVIFIKKVSFSQLRRDDIVTISYLDESGVFTHRITKIDTKKELIYTKGDANSSEDPEPASADHLIGRMWFSLPYLGYISLKYEPRTILMFLAAIVIALVALRFILQLIVGHKHRAERFENESSGD